MKLIDRYLLRVYLIPVFYCLAAFVMIHVVYDLFHNLSKLIAAKAPILNAVEYYLCIVIPVLEYLVPSSLFLATLYTLWGLTRHNELIAMRASGLSLYRILVPFLAVGLAFSVLSLVVREAVTPWAVFRAKSLSESGYREVQPKAFRDIAYYSSQGRRMWMVEELSLQKPNSLSGVKVIQERPDGSRMKQFVAEHADWIDGQWWFHNVQEQSFDTKDHPIAPASVDPGSDTITEMPLLTETPSAFIAQVKDWEFLSAREMIQYVRDHPDLSNEEQAWRRFDVHSRVALPWACLICTLFGVPAGARTGRQGILASIIVAIAFFFGFYTLTHIGVLLGKKQVIWPWMGAWLSNLCFSAVGVWLTVRMR